MFLRRTNATVITENGVHYCAVKLRPAVLVELLCGQPGVEKMKSLVWLKSLWPLFDSNLWQVARQWNYCAQKPSKWTLLHMACGNCQQLHGAYCRPFVHGAIWQQLICTTSSQRFIAFLRLTIASFLRDFSRGAVLHALVTDNGSHFVSQRVDGWLKSVGYRRMLTTPSL